MKRIALAFLLSMPLAAQQYHLVHTRIYVGAGTTIAADSCGPLNTMPLPGVCADSLSQVVAVSDLSQKEEWSLEHGLQILSYTTKNKFVYRICNHHDYAIFTTQEAVFRVRATAERKFCEDR